MSNSIYEMLFSFAQHDKQFLVFLWTISLFLCDLFLALRFLCRIGLFMMCSHISSCVQCILCIYAWRTYADRRVNIFKEELCLFVHQTVRWQLNTKTNREKNNNYCISHYYRLNTIFGARLQNVLHLSSHSVVSTASRAILRFFNQFFYLYRVHRLQIYSMKMCSGTATCATTYLFVKWSLNS